MQVTCNKLQHARIWPWVFLTHVGSILTASYHQFAMSVIISIASYLLVICLAPESNIDFDLAQNTSSRLHPLYPPLSPMTPLPIPQSKLTRPSDVNHTLPWLMFKKKNHKHFYCIQREGVEMCNDTRMHINNKWSNSFSGRYKNVLFIRCSWGQHESSTSWQNPRVLHPQHMPWWEQTSSASLQQSHTVHLMQFLLSESRVFQFDSTLSRQVMSQLPCPSSPFKQHSPQPGLACHLNGMAPLSPRNSSMLSRAGAR